ncbi:MAG: F0F1 ATP synthase subunit A [Armatimonadota bacterium]
MEHEASPWVFFGYSAFVIVILSIFAIAATRSLKRIPISRTQGLLELVIQSLNNFTVGIIGPKGEKYTPFIGTLFIYILIMNLLGLLPGGKAPTASLSITASLAIVVFIYYNYAAIREKSFKAWIQHLMGEPIWLAPLMLPIHLIGELARPLSLSIRLYGNIFGEETVIAILAGMSLVIVRHFIVIPYQFPMMLFGVFTAFVQALVFTMLSAIYISIGVAEEH